MTYMLQAPNAEAAKNALQRILDKTLNDYADLPLECLEVQVKFDLYVDAHVRPERRVP